MRFVRGAILAVSASVAGLSLLPGVVASAEAAPTDPVTLGTSAATAAASCWEIKQKRPTATDGVYWLVTPTMSEPAQFYCDQTTDGGGWVLIAKGRDGWVDDYVGQGAVSELQSPNLATMGPKTYQYPATTVDALLGGGRVDALTDGIRLRRATNTAGTTWQEVRMRMANRDRWEWTFGAEHPLTSWSFDGATGSGGISQNFGSDTTYRRVVSSAQSSQQYRIGFAYGSRVAGSSAATSYVWSYTNNGGGALPYTQMYLRPKLTSDSGFTAIGDSGVAGFTQPPVPNQAALDSPWGVTGIKGDTSDGRNVEVNAFTQSGNTMYVGGNFASVQRDAAGTDRVDQPFLAAFDVTTGELVQSFRPQLNEQVHSLLTLPDGTVVAGGEFTQVNGTPASAVVALDPTTGAIVPGWNAQATTPPTGTRLKVFALDQANGYLYIGGTFTKLDGGTKVGVAARNLGRVSLTDWTPDSKWNPKLDGTVNSVDVSDDGQTIYAAGFFGKSGTVTASKAVALSTAPGAAVTPQFSPVWSSTKNIYQRAVKQVGNRVYIGGSEHSLFGFDAATMNRVTGSIAKQHGDIQAIATDGSRVLYAGCHCNDFFYQNAFTWPTLSAGWTEADALDWVAAVDPATGKTIPNWKPSMKMRQGAGVWAIQMDSRGTLWVGGDIASVTTKSKAGKWAGGFARYDASDSTAPPTPANFRVTAQGTDTVDLAWNLVADAGGGVRYEVLRDDRTVAFTTGNTNTLTVPKGGNNRFYLRAIDKAGNYSATTSVLVP